jgi:hypothetical protein
MTPAFVAVVVFALNNKSNVVLDLWPFGLTVEVPVYLAFLASLVLGALIGGVAAWLGQMHARSVLRDQVYEGEVAKRELSAEREKNAVLQRELDHQRVTGKEPNAGLPALPTVSSETLPLPPS